MEKSFPSDVACWYTEECSSTQITIWNLIKSFIFIYEQNKIATRLVENAIKKDKRWTKKTDPKDTRMTQEMEIMFLFVIILLERFAGEGNGNLLQYSCLENPMDGGAW